MNNPKRMVLIFLILFFALYLSSSQSEQQEKLKPGKFSVGFKLIETVDHTRLYPSIDSKEFKPRPIRVYLWYPSIKSQKKKMTISDYVKMTAEDFVIPKHISEKESLPLLPVQLKKGIDDKQLKILLKKEVNSIRKLPAVKEKFPLLILGQGLYYESPLSHFFLSEFLASHGFIIATCPLLGTHYRLVNINIKDLETQVRDLEFVLSHVKKLPFVDSDKTGIIGYDLGGMTGLILAMRNPNVDAFLSLDSGINFTHFSGMPSSHPSYRESDFIIPWMHMTQGRFIRLFRDEQKKSSLFQRKNYGNSYLVHVPSVNHGCFTSYAIMGIKKPVAGYWGPVEKNLKDIHILICHKALLFLNGYLKQDKNALQKLTEKVKNGSEPDDSFKIEYKEGKTPPPIKASLVNRIINQGIKDSTSVIQRFREIHPSKVLFEESVLNWLGYHFLFWWGREDEAIAIFKLNVQLFPESGNAFDSLGEAYLSKGEKKKAIKCYKKSLELNPENNNAKQILKRLEKQN